MADAYDFLVDGFRAAVADLPVSALEGLSKDQAYELGRRACAAAIAPRVWEQTIGPYFDTAQLVEVLGITRQALNKRLLAGSLIGVQRKGTTVFPSWQFDLIRRTIRPEVRDLTAPFLEELGEIDHFLILSWVNTKQVEDLGGQSPIEWIEKGGDRELLLRAGRRAAARLAV